MVQSPVFILSICCTSFAGVVGTETSWKESLKSFVLVDKTREAASRQQFFELLRIPSQYFYLILPLLCLLFGAVVILAIVRHKNKAVVQNQMTSEEFANKQYTIEEVRKLMQSQAFQDHRKRKGADVNNWNWQARADKKVDGTLVWKEASIEQKLISADENS
eukprot:Filipodium_phascolosomae@DN6977_c0_g1_i1.p1